MKNAEIPALPTISIQLADINTYYFRIVSFQIPEVLPQTIFTTPWHPFINKIVIDALTEPVFIF